MEAKENLCPHGGIISKSGEDFDTEKRWRIVVAAMQELQSLRSFRSCMVIAFLVGRFVAMTLL